MTRTASVQIDATGAQSLHYARRLQLSTFLGEVAFAVVVDDGREHVVDEQAGALIRDAWEQRELRLPALSGGRARLAFRLRAHSAMNYMTSCKPGSTTSRLERGRALWTRSRPGRSAAPASG